MRGTGSARVRIESVQASVFCPFLNILRCGLNILGDGFVTHDVNLESFSGLGTGSRGLCRLARAFSRASISLYMPTAGLGKEVQISCCNLRSPTLTSSSVIVRILAGGISKCEKVLASVSKDGLYFQTLLL